LVDALLVQGPVYEAFTRKLVHAVAQWRVGDVIEDRYGLLVPDDAHTAAYSVEIRLYDAARGDLLVARLAAVNVVSKE